VLNDNEAAVEIIVAEENLLQSNLSAMNPARPGQGSKNCLSKERPATNRLRYGNDQISTVAWYEYTKY